MAALFALLAVSCARAQYATLVGTIQSSNGLPASNFTMSFTPTQFGFIAGTGVVVNSTTFCATTVDGTVVGIANPLQGAQVFVGVGGGGTLPPGNYYVEIVYYNASGVTLPSPEVSVQLVSNGQISILPPTNGLPATATGMNVYIGTSSGGETLQGQTTGSATFVQSTPLATGAALPGANTTVCKQVANDVIWPFGTGYLVSLSDSNGNTIPGYPMTWQLLGAGTTINLSNGLPYYHGIVTFPTPILATPLNHATQSINGGLTLSYGLAATTGTFSGPTYSPAPVVTGSAASGLQTQYGNTSGVISSHGTVFSTGAAFMASNALNTTGADVWSQPSSLATSSLLVLDPTNGTCYYRASVGHAAGTFAAFWGTPIFCADSAGALRTNGNLLIPGTANGYHGTTGTKVQMSDGTGASGNCVKFAVDGSVTDSGAPCGATSIADIQITTGTTLIAANTCTSNTATTMTGLLTTSAVIPPTPTSDTSAVTGWGASGGLSFTYTPTANTFNWRVCNTTGSSITPGSSITWNVGAR